MTLALTTLSLGVVRIRVAYILSKLNNYTASNVMYASTLSLVNKMRHEL